MSTEPRLPRCRVAGIFPTGWDTAHHRRTGAYLELIGIATSIANIWAESVPASLFALGVYLVGFHKVAYARGVLNAAKALTTPTISEVAFHCADHHHPEEDQDPS